ncbi:hypothetical protein [Candidatus Ichthyocystis hellenicum]|uniref:hypothetical protein n=1 Tax=Candidatus Ichthyocystis hellenicum TaxID=1561003 RepID=UPI000B814051|nr:hypothetical protein [Candidatus Ichthyocystis hellenicum]
MSGVLKSYQCVDDDGGSLTESSDFVRDICYGAVGDLEGFPSCSAVIVGSGKSLLSTCYNESYGIEGIIPELEDELVFFPEALHSGIVWSFDGRVFDLTFTPEGRCRRAKVVDYVSGSSSEDEVSDGSNGGESGFDEL